jgi:hypothetical protein
MSSMSSRTDIGRHQLNISSASTATPPTTPANSAEPASIGSGFASQDHAGERSFAAKMSLPSPARDYFYASLGPIREGHYTEF